MIYNSTFVIQGQNTINIVDSFFNIIILNDKCNLDLPLAIQTV